MPRTPALPVHAVTPFTLLDFPGRTACIVWFARCPLRCGYCHNPEVVHSRGRGTIAQVEAFLRRRRGLLDGVVLSGGEATACRGLCGLAATARNLGYAIKLDTSGIRPDVVEALLDRGLLDYVALDYKAPPGKVRSVTGADRFAAFSRTLDLLCAQGAVPFEVRTTVHTALLDEADVSAIIRDLEHRGYRGTYYVQDFRADDGRPALGRLAPQARALDCAALPVPHGFAIGFRNFA